MPGSRDVHQQQVGVETAGHAEASDAVRRHVQFGVGQLALDEQADQVLKWAESSISRMRSGARLLVGAAPRSAGRVAPKLRVGRGPRHRAGGRPPAPRCASQARMEAREMRRWPPGVFQACRSPRSTISCTERTAMPSHWAASVVEQVSSPTAGRALRVRALAWQSLYK